MQHQFPVVFQNINFTIDDKPLFKALDLTIPFEKIGIVGPNGIGKTCLLRLITNEITPQSGQVILNAKIAYSPQQPKVADEETVAGILGVKEKLAALDRIANGSIDSDDYDIVADDWLIAEKSQNILAHFNLNHLQLSQRWCELSGGQKTRLFLARTFLQDADLLLLDEPSNNLDLSAKKRLYQRVSESKQSMLIVSHDRSLLNLMDRIVELTPKGIFVYGGNFDFYREQKALQTAAIERELLDAKKQIKKTKKSIQQSFEKHEQKRSKGVKERRAGNIDKLAANSKKGRSEKTQSKNVTRDASMLARSTERFQSAIEKQEVTETLGIHLQKTQVPNNKIIVSIEQLTFSYDAKVKLFDDYNCLIQGPERVALIGDNGSGKTTLVKLICGELKPLSGSVGVGVNQINYLDQQASGLIAGHSILENFIVMNPDINLTEAHHALAQFLFRNTDAHRCVDTLSGGERLRALLACVLMSQTPPQLLILDEPTNHLDFASIASIESALQAYQGALIVISHDQHFLENIGVSRYIKL